jgi:hypothetical protein
VSLRAPIAVPVELRADTRRVFRLARSIGEDGVRLVRPAPFDVGREVKVRLVLPGGTSTLAMSASVQSADADEEDRLERASGREVAFIDASQETRAAISAYVKDRLRLPR